MRIPAACLLVLLIGAGCIDAAPEEKGDVETDGRMLATSGFVAHDGSGSVTAIPDGTIGRPDSCILYRNDLAYSDGGCTIKDGPPAHPPSAGGSWHVEARWEASDAGAEDTMERLREKSIVAFDADGNPIAEWDGRDEEAYHPEFQMAVE